MQLLIVRHGVAGTREEFAATGQDDALRPLTAKGKRKMARNAKGIRRLVGSVDVLGASALVRAAQTAEILAKALGGIAVTTVPALAPDSTLEAGIAWLRRQRGAGCVAVVGHEPHLSTFATWLMTGERDSRLALRKGGACLLDLGARTRPGGATLVWALTPALLRRVGGR